MRRVYRIVRIDREGFGKSEEQVEEEIVRQLDEMGKDGWRVIQDLNQEPHCHKFLLERDVVSCGGGPRDGCAS